MSTSTTEVPSSSQLGDVECVAPDCCRGMTSDALSIGETTRRVGLPPLANHSSPTPAPERGRLLAGRSSSTVATALGGEEMPSLASSCVKPSNEKPPASAKAQEEGGAEDENVARVSAEPSFGGSPVRGARSSVFRVISTSGDPGRFDRLSPSRADARRRVDVYCDVLEDAFEDGTARGDAEGAGGIQQPPSQGGSRVLNEEGASTSPCADAILVPIPVGSSRATQPDDQQETEAGTSSSDGAVEMTPPWVNEVQVASKEDLEEQGGGEKPAATFYERAKSFVGSFFNELRKHPILDSGSKTASRSALRGRLHLTYCTCSVVIFVYILQVVIDRTTFQARCISPILYPDYRLPLKDRMPVLVDFGYGACRYNLEGPKTLLGPAPPAGNTWPANNVDAPTAPSVPKMSGWEGSMMGGLDTNKMRNYNEYFRIFTCMFLHGSWLHMLTNVTTLFVLLWLIEPVWGTLRTALTFLISGLTAAVCDAVFSPCIISLGASGGAYGLIGALFPLTIEFWDYVEYPMFSLFLLVLNLVILQLINFCLLENVDNFAHAVGFLAGIMFGFVTATSLHAWRWQGLHERLASSNMFSWIFSPEERERLQAAQRTRGASLCSFHARV